MKRSTDRILTTHTGSLPRPDDLVELLMQRDRGELTDMAAFEARVAEATQEVVQKQRDTGIDIVNDGEGPPTMPKGPADAEQGAEGDPPAP